MYDLPTPMLMVLWEMTRVFLLGILQAHRIDTAHIVVHPSISMVHKPRNRQIFHGPWILRLAAIVILKR